jgi:succinyl-diaminopimelate desuccinylase
MSEVISMSENADRIDVIEITKELVKIDTRNPPGETTRAVEFLEELFSSFNTKIYEKVEGKPSLVVEVKSGEPEIMLTSHLDTVPAPDELLNPVMADGRLYGRGACDAKGCVAAMVVAAFEYLKRIEELNSENPGLKLAFTSDEEVGGVNGLGHVFRHEQSDFVIIGEPLGMGYVGALQACVVSADLTVKGESGHTATKDAKEGAIYRAAEYIISKVEEFSKLKGSYSEIKEKFSRIGYDFEIRGVSQAVFNPSGISGGTKRNVVADSCRIEADIRFAPWIPREEIRRVLRDEGVEIKVNGVLEPYGVFMDEVKEDDDLKLLNAIKRVYEGRGVSAVAVFSLGVGDTRHVRKYGIPAVYLGPGGGELHGKNEYVNLDELKDFPSIYVDVMNELTKATSEK